MATPNTRAEFREHCLRRLGKPVLEINVDDDQLEDRIDEALEFFYEHDQDAYEKIFRRHQVTQTDINNGYITMPDEFINVLRVFPLQTNKLTGNIFSAKYQFHLNQVPHLFGGGGVGMEMQTYTTARSYLNLVDFLLEGEKSIRFVRHKNYLRIDVDWDETFDVGDWLVIEAYRKVEPESGDDTESDVFTDIFLQRYATALIKRQWGINLKKFTGMTLPGGVQFNGQQIYDEAIQEIQQLEQETLDRWNSPPDFFVG